MTDQKKPWRPALERVAKLMETEKFEAAERTLLKLIPDLEKSNDPDDRVGLGLVYLNLLRIYNVTGEEEDTLPLIERSLECLEGNHEFVGEFIELLQIKASDVAVGDEYEEMEACLSRADALATEYFGPSSPAALLARIRLAECQAEWSVRGSQKGSVEVSMGMFDGIRDACLSTEFFDVYTSFCGSYVHALFIAGNHDGVVIFLRKEWEKLSQTEFRDEDQIEFARHVLLENFIRTQNFPDAFKVFDAIMRNIPDGIDDVLRGDILILGAESYSGIGDAEKADALFLEGLSLLEGKIPSALGSTEYENRYADFLWAQNRFDEAAEIYDSSMASILAEPTVIHFVYVQRLLDYIEKLRSIKRVEEARAVAQKVREIVSYSTDDFSNEELEEIKSQLNF